MLPKVGIKLLKISYLATVWHKILTRENFDEWVSGKY